MAALTIAQSHGVPDIVARVLAGRGVTAEGAERFLDPTIRDLLPDPASLTDMERGGRASRGSHRAAARRSRSSATTMSTARHPRRC